MLNLQEKTRDIKHPVLSEEEKKKTVQLNQLFEEAQNLKEKPFRYFENRNLETFIQDCRDRFTSYTKPRDKSWKARVFKPKTRNKVLAVVAQLTASIIKPQFIAQNPDQEVDRHMSEVIDNLYEYSTQLDGFEKKFVLAVLQGCVDGTIHILDEYQNRTRTIKEIIDTNWDTGEIKFKKKKKKDFEGLYSTIVPALEIYPGDIYTFDIQNQPYIFRRRLCSYAEAMGQFQNYKNWEYIRPGVFYDYNDQDNLFIEKEESDTDNNLVDIREYWCKQDDEYHIMINGILMTQSDNPIPYDHKSYPFAKTVFEPFDVEFYWGNSLVNKMKYEQDIVNLLYKMIIDKKFLGLFPPIITDDDRILKSNVIVPGAQIQGNPDRITSMKDFIGDINNSDFNLLSSIEASIDESSINPVSAGQTGTAANTATQDIILQQNAKIMLGLFGTFITFLIEDFAKLRISNIISFYPEIEEMDKITLLDKTLISGKVGNKQLQFEDMPETMTESDIEKRSFELMNESIKDDGKKDITVINKKLFKNMYYYVRTVASPEPKKTETLMRVLAGSEFDRLANNPLINQIENTRDLLRAYNKDESKFLQEPQQEPQQQPKQNEQAVNQIKNMPKAPLNLEKTNISKLV